jgi:hypothetical protein
MTRFNTRRYKCPNPACGMEHDLHDHVKCAIEWTAKQGTKRVMVDAEQYFWLLTAFSSTLNEVDRLHGIEDRQAARDAPKAH